MPIRFMKSKIIAGLLAFAALQGCQKVSNIGKDNDTVILTPHTVIASTDEGWLVKTNDGRTFNSMFPPDGYAATMVSSAGANVIMLKSRIFYSDNNGKNFNPSTYMDFNPKPWRYWVFDCPAHKRTYMASKIGNGVAYSEDGGITWKEDKKWQANTSPNVMISSFAQLSNNAVFAFNDDYNVLYRRDAVDDNWNAVVVEGVFPSASAYFLTSNNTDLFIVDYNGFGGAWYSLNEGVNWTKFGVGELPTSGNEKFVGAASGASGTLAVATENDVYFANTTSSFVKANTGLDIGTKIYGITGKYNVYKDGNRVNFLYIATTKGIYRSDDNGFSWDKVSFNEYNTAYTAIY